MQFRYILLPLLAAAALSAADVTDWPQWRGPQRDGCAAPTASVPAALPSTLQPVWRLDIGPGFSSPIVAGPVLIYLDERNGNEVVHALDADQGRELWNVPFSPSFGDEWGSGPRSTPFVDEDRVYAQSCRGDVVCLRLKDGSRVWQTSYEKDFGVKFEGAKANSGTATRRGNNGCGVIDGDCLVLPVGSTAGASLVGFDKRTGQVRWKAGNDEAAYSALMPATLAGTRQVVALTATALQGLRLTDGQILWRVPLKTAANRHAATPVIQGNRVMVNSHSFGLVCIEVSRDGDTFVARQAWINKNAKINIATPVRCGDYLYSQGPNKDFICVDARTGELRWSQPGFGQGRKDYSSAVKVGDRLLVLSDSGTLFLLAADPARYRELGRLQVCGGTWAFPAYARGKLFARDASSLICLDLQSSAPASP